MQTRSMGTGSVVNFDLDLDFAAITQSCGLRAGSQPLDGADAPSLGHSTLHGPRWDVHAFMGRVTLDSASSPIVLEPYHKDRATRVAVLLGSYIVLCPTTFNLTFHFSTIAGFRSPRQQSCLGSELRWSRQPQVRLLSTSSSLLICIASSWNCRTPPVCPAFNIGPNETTCLPLCPGCVSDHCHCPDHRTGQLPANFVQVFACATLDLMNSDE